MEDALRIDRERQELIAVVKAWIQRRGPAWTVETLNEAVGNHWNTTVEKSEWLALEERRANLEETRERTREIQLRNDQRAPTGEKRRTQS